jgi:hypothetical protein
MRFFSRAVAASCVLLSGCAVTVATTPVEKYDAQPDNTSGWVAGVFTRDQTTDLAFVVHNNDTNVDYYLPIGEDSKAPTLVFNQVLSIPVPPGHYEITQWVTFRPLNKRIFTRKDVDNLYLSAPFVVAPGSVTFLGRFSANGRSDYRTLSWYVLPQRIKVAEAHRVFDAAYPAFANNTFACLMCMETTRKIFGGPKLYGY